MLKWPERVWERGRIDENGRQLWYSRQATVADHRRRKKIDLDFQLRRLRGLT